MWRMPVPYLAVLDVAAEVLLEAGPWAPWEPEEIRPSPGSLPLSWREQLCRLLGGRQDRRQREAGVECVGWGGHPQSSRSLKRWAGGGGLLLRGDTTQGCISVPGTKASNGTSLRPGLPHTPSLLGPGTTLEMWPRYGREGTPLQTRRQPNPCRIDQDKTHFT